MFIGFPPTFVFSSGLPEPFLPTHHIYYSQRLFDMNDDLPKYAGHKEGGPRLTDDDEVADQNQGRGAQANVHEDDLQGAEIGRKEKGRGNGYTPDD